MKKIIGVLIVLIILVALILGGYYVTGMVTERTLKKDVSMINQSNGLQVDIKQYRRHWFTSKVLLNWKLHIPERVVKNQNGQAKVIPEQNYTMNMPLNVVHGPIIFANNGVHFGLGYAQTKLELPEPFKQQFASNLASDSKAPHLNASVLVNYLNQSRFRWEMPQFVMNAKDGQGQFEWLGSTSDVTVTSNLDQIEGDLTIDGIKAFKENTKVTLGKVTVEYDLHQDKSGLYLGDASLAIPSLTVDNNGQTAFELDDFSAESKSNIDNDLFNSYLEISLNKAIVQGKQYGPGEVKAAIKNLNATVLAQINEQANNLQEGTEQARQQASFALLMEVPKLFNKGAELEISKLDFTLPEGKIEGQLSVSLPKMDSTNPFQMIQQVKGEGELKLPAVVVKQMLIESARQQLIQQPTLTQALTQQMQPAGSADQSPVADAAAVNGQSTTQTEEAPAKLENQKSEPITSQTTLAQLNSKAEARAEENLQSLIRTGVLKPEGNEYLIHLKLENGQLSVNEHPFNPAMLTF